MRLERSGLESKKEIPPFSTACFGFETKNPAIRALDWLEKWRSEAHVARGVEGYLTKGVRSRKERFGELLGRAIDGHFREPQDVVHLHTPYYSSRTIVSNDPMQNWKNFFESETVKLSRYPHTAYFMLDVPEIRLDNYKGKQYVMPDSTPQADREIKALFIRKDAFSKERLQTILAVCNAYSLPVFDLTSLEKVDA